MTPPIIEDTVTRQLVNSKQPKITVDTGHKPLVSDLPEGNPVFRFVAGKGMYLFLRHKNKMYWTKMNAANDQSIVKILDITGGTINAKNAVDDTTSSVKDDIATITDRVNQIIDRI
jgi:hypothetical protein